MTYRQIPVIDIDRALDLLKQARDSKPEGYVYERTAAEDAIPYRSTCVYQGDDGAPRCIVGVALSLHTPEWWNKIPTVTINASASHLTADEVTTSAAGQVFHAAQRAQDDGGTWEEAVTRAEERAAYLRRLPTV